MSKIVVFAWIVLCLQELTHHASLIATAPQGISKPLVLVLIDDGTNLLVADMHVCNVRKVLH